jgi:hypothetical protein
MAMSALTKFFNQAWRRAWQMYYRVIEHREYADAEEGELKERMTHEEVHKMSPFTFYDKFSAISDSILFGQ